MTNPTCSPVIITSTTRSSWSGRRRIRRRHGECVALLSSSEDSDSTPAIPSPPTSPNQTSATTTTTTMRHSPVGESTPAVKGGGGGGKVVVASPEEGMALQISIESQGFLNNIIEYGKNRMARRAVGILQKMPAYKIQPDERHYTAALWACERSDQYGLAIGIYQEMIEKEIIPTLSSYEALLSISEKTGHYEDVIKYFEEMKKQMKKNDDIMMMNSNSSSSSSDKKEKKSYQEIYNIVLSACSHLGFSQEAIQYLEEMIQYNISRDVSSYTACISACGYHGDSKSALKIFQEMKEEGMELLNAVTYSTILWACLRSGDGENVLVLWDDMIYHKIEPNIDCFHAVIWACDMVHDPYKAVEYLKLMKMNGFIRTAMAFDGTISALAKANDWTMILEVWKWMDRDNIERTGVTYKITIECLDRNGQEDLIGDVYNEALRHGFFSPWIKQTRRMDLRGFSLPIAKIALKTVFLSMKDHKLSIFPLVIIVGDEVVNNQNGEKEYYSSFDADDLYRYLTSLQLFSTGKTKQADGITLKIDRIIEEGHDCLLLTREALKAWLEQEHN